MQILKENISDLTFHIISHTYLYPYTMHCNIGKTFCFVN